jgi:hypothetical protein
MLWLERHQWHHAAMIYGEHLGPRLVADYGGEPPYTVAQVDAAIRRLNLNPKYSALGYVEFISVANYGLLRKANPGLLDREVARVLHERYGPWAPAASDTFEDPRGFSGIGGRPYAG